MVSHHSIDNLVKNTQKPLLKEIEQLKNELLQLKQELKEEKEKNNLLLQDRFLAVSPKKFSAYKNIEDLMYDFAAIKNELKAEQSLVNACVGVFNNVREMMKIYDMKMINNIAEQRVKDRKIDLTTTNYNQGVMDDNGLTDRR